MSLWSHEISEDGRYRYRLRWCNDILPARALVWIMLNPSKATAEKPDPTVRRVLRLTQQAGFHALEILNLFAFRSTNPGLMFRADDPVGPSNDHAIACVLDKERSWDGVVDVVEAWGCAAERADVKRRIVDLRCLLFREGITVRRHELGRTKDGHPWHPLQRGEKFTGLHLREEP